MKVERSAGILVTRRSRRGRQYLLLKHRSGHWDFPKGHIEKGESSSEAALRETEEEAGIKKLTIVPHWKQTIRYMYNWKGEKRLKFVVFFLATTREKKITYSREHRGARWAPFEKAYAIIKHKNARELIKKANRHFAGRSENQEG